MRMVCRVLTAVEGVLAFCYGGGSVALLAANRQLPTLGVAAAIGVHVAYALALAWVGWRGGNAITRIVAILLVASYVLLLTVGTCGALALGVTLPSAFLGLLLATILVGIAGLVALLGDTPGMSRRNETQPDADVVLKRGSERPLVDSAVAALIGAAATAIVVMSSSNKWSVHSVLCGLAFGGASAMAVRWMMDAPWREEARRRPRQ